LEKFGVKFFAFLPHISFSKGFLGAKSMSLVGGWWGVPKSRVGSTPKILGFFSEFLSFSKFDVRLLGLLVCIFFPNLARRLLVRSAFRSLREIRFLTKRPWQGPPKLAKNFGEFSFKNR